MGTGAFNVVWPQAFVMLTNLVLMHTLTFSKMIEHQSAQSISIQYYSFLYEAQFSYKNAMTPSIVAEASAWVIRGIYIK